MQHFTLNNIVLTLLSEIRHDATPVKRYIIPLLRGRLQYVVLSQSSCTLHELECCAS